MNGGRVLDLGLVGFEAHGGDGVATLVGDGFDLMDLPPRLTFLEGFADVAGDSAHVYAWEVWTQASMGEWRSDGDSRLLASIRLLGVDFGTVDVIERHVGVRWTQLVINEPYFSPQILATLNSVPEDWWGLVFSPVPRNDSNDDGDTTPTER